MSNVHLEDSSDLKEKSCLPVQCGSETYHAGVYMLNHYVWAMPSINC